MLVQILPKKSRKLIDCSSTSIKLLTISPTNETEIINIVKSLSENKSPGHDEVYVPAPSVLKSIIVSIVIPLVHIFNLSFHHGQFPTSLKLAKVVPIFKYDDKLSVRRLIRPITGLSVFSKVSEKLMFKRMSICIENHAILSYLD